MICTSLIGNFVMSLMNLFVIDLFFGVSNVSLPALSYFGSITPIFFCDLNDLFCDENTESVLGIRNRFTSRSESRIAVYTHF